MMTSGAAGAKGRPRWPAWLVLGLYLIAIAAVFAWPNGGQIRVVQIRSWWWVRTHIWSGLSPEQWSTFVNAALIVPVTAACVVLLPRVPWLVWLGLTVVGASSIEIGQALFLAGRHGGQVHDALSNIVGGAIGIGLGWWFNRRTRVRELQSSAPGQSGGDTQSSADTSV